VVAKIDKNGIREHLLEGLAWVRDVDRAELDSEVSAHGGDLRIDSKEGEAVCVLVEDALGLGELVQVADLKPEELSSLSSLTDLFDRRIGDHLARTGKDAA
jgi:hypothetical protein